MYKYQDTLPEEKSLKKRPEPEDYRLEDHRDSFHARQEENTQNKLDVSQCYEPTSVGEALAVLDLWHLHHLTENGSL